METFLEYIDRGEILYHGTENRELSDFDVTDKGIWFTTEPENEIMSYYKSRGKLMKVLFKPKNAVIDLTDFDVNENLVEDGVRDFVVDVMDSVGSDLSELSDILVDIEENIEPRFEGEDYYYTYSEVFNFVVKNYIIGEYGVSAIRINESGFETVIVFNRDELEIIK